MRYHHEPKEIAKQNYGIVYICDHPLYSRCTLYLIEGDGLAVIQQRFDSETKRTFWTEIDPWLNDEIYLSEGFLLYFKLHAGRQQNGLYPTVTVRQIMWALRMKPLPKQRWETVFDRRAI